MIEVSQDIDVNNENYERPIQWDEYEKIINNEWTALMNSKKTTVADVKAFIVQHPSMLLNPIESIMAGTDPRFPAIVLNPILPAFTGPQPDFLSIGANSLSINANFFILGNPQVKQTCNNFKIPEVSKTIDNICEWEAWFRDSKNCLDFYDFYNMSNPEYKWLTFNHNYFYIFGRRAGGVDGKLANLRNSKFNGNKRNMSYYRLCPNRSLYGLYCVEPNNNGFKVISIPPTLEWASNYGTGFNSPFIYNFKEMDIAIKENKYITEIRRTYLLSTCLKHIEDAKKKHDSGKDIRFTGSKDIRTESTESINRKRRISLLDGERVKNTFYKSGDFWTITYEEKDTFHLKNLDGLNYIHVLLANPDKDIFVTDLMKQTGKKLNQSDFRGPNQNEVNKEELKSVSNSESKGFNVKSRNDIYDDEYKKEIQEKISELMRDKEDAENFGTDENVAKIQNAIDDLVKEIKASKKGAKFANEYKTIATAVYNSINRAYTKIKDKDESLWRHLKNCIKTGKDLSYKPDKKMDWELKIF